MVVTRTVTPVTTNFLADMMQVWCIESMMAMNERLDAIGQTNLFVDLLKNQASIASGQSALTTDFNNRSTLIKIKDKIESVMSSFADMHEGDPDYDAHFLNNPNYVWTDTDADGTADRWVGTNVISQTFPVVTVTTLVNGITGFPFTTNIVKKTNDVNGWFAGQFTTGS